MLNLTINGKPCQAPEGVTILEAARQNGIHIPSLCYLKNVHQYGTCRICGYEVNVREDKGRPQSSEPSTPRHRAASYPGRGYSRNFERGSSKRAERTPRRGAAPREHNSEPFYLNRFGKRRRYDE